VARIEVDDDALVIVVGKTPATTTVFVGPRQVGYIQHLRFETSSDLDETVLDMALIDEYLPELQGQTLERCQRARALLQPHLRQEPKPAPKNVVRTPAWKRLR
jgi:hypothetical protein